MKIIGLELQSEKGIKEITKRFPLLVKDEYFPTSALNKIERSTEMVNKRIAEYLKMMYIAAAKQINGLNLKKQGFTLGKQDKLMSYYYKNDIFDFELTSLEDSFQPDIPYDGARLIFGASMYYKDTLLANLPKDIRKDRELDLFGYTFISDLPSDLKKEMEVRRKSKLKGCESLATLEWSRRIYEKDPGAVISILNVDNHVAPKELYQNKEEYLSRLSQEGMTLEQMSKQDMREII